MRVPASSSSSNVYITIYYINVYSLWYVAMQLRCVHHETLCVDSVTFYLSLTHYSPDVSIRPLCSFIQTQPLLFRVEHCQRTIIISMVSIINNNKNTIRVQRKRAPIASHCIDDDAGRWSSAPHGSDRRRCFGTWWRDEAHTTRHDTKKSTHSITISYCKHLC